MAKSPQMKRLVPHGIIYCILSTACLADDFNDDLDLEALRASQEAYVKVVRSSPSFIELSHLHQVLTQYLEFTLHAEGTYRDSSAIAQHAAVSHFSSTILAEMPPTVLHQFSEHFPETLSNLLDLGSAGLSLRLIQQLVVAGESLEIRKKAAEAGRYINAPRSDLEKLGLYLLGESDPELRQTARGFFLRTLTRDEAQQIRQRIFSIANPAIRASIVNILETKAARKNPISRTTFDLIADVIRTDPSNAVRRAWLEYLGLVRTATDNISIKLYQELRDSNAAVAEVADTILAQPSCRSRLRHLF